MTFIYSEVGTFLCITVITCKIKINFIQLCHYKVLLGSDNVFLILSALYIIKTHAWGMLKKHSHSSQQTSGAELDNDYNIYKIN